MVFIILDPVGEVVAADKVVSTGLKSAPGQKVGYVFNHHPAGEAIWTAMEEHIDKVWKPSAKNRVDKTNVSVPAPTSELSDLQKKADYFIVGVGACGSCTAAAVHDGYTLSKLGVPVVVIVQSVFEAAAKIQARILGAPDLPICSYVSPISQAEQGQMSALGADLAEKALKMIVSRKVREPAALTGS
jgi:hypothetical protein